MSDMYAIKGSTLTALGDAVRNKVIGDSEPIITIPEQSILYNKTYTFQEFPDFVKKIKVLGTGKYSIIWDGNANGYHGVGIAPGVYTTPASARRAEGFTVVYTFDMDTIYDGTYFDFEAIVEGNSFTIVVPDNASGPTGYRLTYTAIGLDENGNEFKYTPLEMADAINALNIPNIQPIILTEDCSYGCSGALATAYINNFGDTITTDGLKSTSNMFFSYAGETIPFVLNYYNQSSLNLNYMFAHCNNLKTVPTFGAKPKLGSTQYMFTDCWNLNNIPEDFGVDWDWSGADNETSSYGSARSYMFQRCYSLRKLPMKFLEHGNPMANYSYAIYSYMVNACYSLDEIVDLPNPHKNAAWTSNAFNSMVNDCYRLKRFTFKDMDAVNWKSQTIDFSSNVGYAYKIYSSRIYDYNSGITADKEVKDAATYEALKNDPDWFTCDVNYSRYNHDSAVETINSLPDCSATGTNTIKFKGASGALTDGGAINTLTEEEIAVATAKGWTVSLV